MNDTEATTTTDTDEVAPRTVYLPVNEPIVRKGDRYVIRGHRRLGLFDSPADAFDAWAAMDAERDFEPVVPVAI